MPRYNGSTEAQLQSEAAMMPLAVAIAGAATSSGGGAVVALISSVRREGTTSVAAALGSAFERGLSRPVAIIDVNLYAPRLHEIHGLPSGPGLVDVLRGDSTLQSALNVTGSGLLAILTAGRMMPGDHSLLVNSRRLGVLLDRIRAEGFEFCLLDCPAVLPSPDATLLATQADATFLVTKAEQTRWEVLRKAASQLTNGGAQLRGTILNHYRAHLPSFLDRHL